jgi:hypothetical protein
VLPDLRGAGWVPSGRFGHLRANQTTDAMVTTVTPVIRLKVSDGYPTSPSTSMIT